jgi:orotate phosphoribosyltransferase-like protein
MDSRRKTVVELASKGLTTNQIAVAVNVSARTVVRDLAYIATTKKPPGRELPRHGLEEEVK